MFWRWSNVWRWFSQRSRGLNFCTRRSLEPVGSVPSPTGISRGRIFVFTFMNKILDDKNQNRHYFPWLIKWFQQKHSGQIKRRMRNWRSRSCNPLRLQNSPARPSNFHLRSHRCRNKALPRSRNHHPNLESWKFQRLRPCRYLRIGTGLLGDYFKNKASRQSGRRSLQVAFWRSSSRRPDALWHESCRCWSRLSTCFQQRFR